ncbi:MAG: hypothetical protein RLN76_07190 [Phycisphaeraceae bacterium]
MDKFEALLQRLEGVRASSGGYMTLCPAHADQKPSLSIRRGGSGRILVHCFAGCDTRDVLRAIGLDFTSLMPEESTLPDSATAGRPHRPVRGPKPSRHKLMFSTAKEVVAELERRHGKRSAEWVYRDDRGEPVGVVLRWDLKHGTKLILPVSRIDNAWVHGAMPKPRPLYRLPELLASSLDETIFISEGEKAADVVASLGLLATTTPGGCQAVHHADLAPLAGRYVILLPDNDPPGEKYAQLLSDSLSYLDPPARVRILRLPHLPPKGDVVDRLNQLGGDLRLLRRELELGTGAVAPPAAYGIGDDHD